jgi:hypothetical protein
MSPGPLSMLGAECPTECSAGVISVLLYLDVALRCW